MSWRGSDTTQIQLKSKVGADGMLNLKVAVGAQDANKEVIVTVQSASVEMTREQWLEFVRETAGSINDPTFFRHDQGEFEKREELE
jgi:hypothetical protein